MSFIRLSGISKSYPDGENRLNHVLQGVDLNVAQGGFIAVKGSSGSGKTTLLEIMGTLRMPDSGAYLLNGTDMITPGIKHDKLRNSHIGFVFQNHNLMPQLGVLENILLPALAFQSQVTTPQLEYARHLMQITGIDALEKQYPQTLSGGEASRVALCRALIMKPLLILADEPTGQLDGSNARNIAALLLKINQTLGTTIVMATHSDEVSAVAQQIYMLKEGKLS